jgi:hypothetical protein
VEIERLSRTDDADAKELLSKGSIVTVSIKDGSEVSEMGGHRLALPTQEAIMVVLPLDPNGPTYDELFGTNERKKPGDQWDVNTDFIVQDLTSAEPSPLRKSSRPAKRSACRSAAPWTAPSTFPPFRAA